MKNAVERMKYWVNHDKMEVEFSVWDLVSFRLGSEHLKPLLSELELQKRFNSKMFHFDARSLHFLLVNVS